VIVCPEVTTKVTGTLSGLPVAPVEAMVTVPLYVAGGSVPAFTDTFTLPGVVPVAVSTESQLPELLLVAVVTVYESAPGAPTTARVCDAGTAPPAT
jgi:hypothetical protein